MHDAGEFKLHQLMSSRHSWDARDYDLTLYRCWFHPPAETGHTAAAESPGRAALNLCLRMSRQN
jgi:hypothetical protein